MSPFRRVIRALRKQDEQRPPAVDWARFDRANRLVRWDLCLRDGDRINTEVELLTHEHEVRLVAEHGSEALYNYYVDRGTP